MASLVFIFIFGYYFFWFCDTYAFHGHQNNFHSAFVRLSSKEFLEEIQNRENIPLWKKIIKENNTKFIKPSENEKCKNLNTIEGGCYW